MDSKKAWARIRRAQELKVKIDPELIDEMKAECPKYN